MMVKGRGLGYLISKILFVIIDKIETLLIGKRYEKINCRYPLSLFKVDFISVVPVVSDSGFVYRYTESDINLIKEIDLDVLVRGGSGILRGEILNVCKYGVLSFHHANNEVNRGGPPGFWEVFNKESSTGFVIQRLTEELDGGAVIFKASIPTSRIYKLNQNRLYAKSSVFMHRALEGLGVNDGFGVIFEKHPYSYRLYRLPNAIDIIKYLYRVYFALIFDVLTKIIGLQYRWGVAYQIRKDWRDVVLWKSKIIKNPPNRFFADPFAIEKNNRKIIYVEDFDYRVGKGKITALEISDCGEKILGTALEEQFHLSYPFLFEDGDNLYMIPETHQSNDIRVYKCVDFPLGWKLHKILIDNVSAADTIMFRHNGKFWLMTNLDSAGMDDHCSELHIYSADSFDSDAWNPHPLNPVIFDSACARNGGFIYSEDKLYRVYQSQEFKIYGASIGVAEIIYIGLDNYEERLVSNIRARFFENIVGTHTFTFGSGVLCVDFSRYQNIK